MWYNIYTKNKGRYEDMKKGKVKITIEFNALDYMKESQEQRKERVRNSKPMGTKTEKNKKAYKRHPKHKGARDYE